MFCITTKLLEVVINNYQLSYYHCLSPTSSCTNLLAGQRIYEWALASIWFSYYVDMVQNLVTLDASWAMKLRLWLQSEWSLLDFCYLHLALVSFALNGVFPDYVKGWSAHSAIRLSDNSSQATFRPKFQKATIRPKLFN